MSKKILSIVLAVVMLMSICAVSSFAADTAESMVNQYILGKYFGTMSATKVASYLNSDPDIITRNLAFWDDQFIANYNNGNFDDCLEAMENDWVEVDYGEGETEPLEAYYPLGLKTGKAKADVKYTTDVTTAKAGDTITVTYSIKTNFYTNSINGGIIYDKSLVEVVADSLSVTERSCWTLIGAAYNYGFLSTGKDNRFFMWPASMRENKNNEYNTYGMFRASFGMDGPDGTADKPFSYKFDDFTSIYSVKFKVKTGVPDNTEIKFFATDDSNPTTENDFVIYEENSEQALNSAIRSLSPIVGQSPTDCSIYDQTWTYTPVTVNEKQTGLDLTSLTNAVNAYSETNKADYTSTSWKAYKDAVDAGAAIVSDSTGKTQTDVNNATSLITTKLGELAKNYVVSATASDNNVIGAMANIDVVVTGNASQIRIVGGGSTFTFERAESTVVDNKDGTEKWTVKLFASSASATYDVFAKYVSVTDKSVSVTVTASEGLDLTIHSIATADMYEVTNGGVIEAGQHNVVIETSTDVYKIQFVDTHGTIESGSTYTYDLENPRVSYADNEGVRTWTIYHNFSYGEINLPIRTRSEFSTFAYTGDALQAYGVY